MRVTASEASPLLFSPPLTNNNPFGKGDFTQNYEISVGIWKSASDFSLFYLGE